MDKGVAYKDLEEKHLAFVGWAYNRFDTSNLAAPLSAGGRREEKDDKDEKKEKKK